jgi:hypothetical protein
MAANRRLGTDLIMIHTRHILCASAPLRESLTFSAKLRDCPARRRGAEILFLETVDAAGNPVFEHRRTKVE